MMGMNNPDISNIRAFPANLLKFNAYIKVTNSLDDAIKVVQDKKLAYGQPCVVTYKSKKNTVGGKKTVQHILFAIGSMDPDKPYFVNVYGEDGNYVSVDDLMPEIYKILEAFEGKTPVRIKIGSQPNVTTKYKDGDIILGDAAIKRVTDIIEEKSGDLVTGNAVYNMFKNFNDALEIVINDILSRLDTVESDIIRLSDLEPRMDVVDSSINAITVKVGQQDASIGELYEAVFGPDPSGGGKTYAVVADKGIKVVTKFGISKVGIDYDNFMYDAIATDETALKINEDGTIGAYWSGF